MAFYPRAYSAKDLKPNKPMLSWRKDKKMVVLAMKPSGIKKVVHFGQKGYEDYTIHKDNERRKRYLVRSAGIKNKGGKLTKNDVFSANYWSRKILW